MAAASGSATSRTLLPAAVLAATLSGAPSTVDALVRRTDPLAATRAAGRLLAPRARREPIVLAAAAIAHGALSLAWTAALQRLPRGTARAAAYGLAVAALDLGVAHTVRGARFGPIAELRVLPQLADHVLFAVIVDVVSSGSGDGCRRSTRGCSPRRTRAR